jgi:hypothetical protein
MKSEASLCRARRAFDPMGSQKLITAAQSSVCVARI